MNKRSEEHMHFRHEIKFYYHMEVLCLVLYGKMDIIDAHKLVKKNVIYNMDLDNHDFDIYTNEDPYYWAMSKITSNLPQDQWPEGLTEFHHPPQPDSYQILEKEILHMLTLLQDENSLFYEILFKYHV